jgi:hypothetical protein
MGMLVIPHAFPIFPGLDRHHARHELGPLVGDVKANAASLRMSDQDDRASDLIEERHAGRHGQLGLGGDKLHLALDEIIEHRIAHRAFLRRVARPLRVQLHPRKIPTGGHRTGPDLLQVKRSAQAQFAVHVGDVRRAPARRVIHHVYDITLVN